MMARISGITGIIGAAVMLLGGCSSGQDTSGDLQPETASPSAACNGYVRAFGDAPSQAVSLTCNGTERAYVAYADNIAHRFSPCAFTFEAANGGTGMGRMNCSNGCSGPLTYDMTDAAGIKVVADLDDGRQMAFTLRAE